MSARRTVYLDHSASTPTDPRVDESMLPYFSEVYGNPSSAHSFGRKSEQAIEAARETVARLLTGTPHPSVTPGNAPDVARDRDQAQEGVRSSSESERGGTHTGTRERTGDGRTRRVRPDAANERRDTHTLRQPHPVTTATIVNAGHRRALQLGLALPDGELEAASFDISGPGDPTLVITLENVLVTGYGFDGAAGDRPMESVSMNFTRIEWTWETGATFSMDCASGVCSCR